MDEEPKRPATERAEELLTRVGETAGIFASLIGTRIARIAAFAREEAEDMWAEAQSISQQPPKAETNQEVTAEASEDEAREQGEGSETAAEAKTTMSEGEEQEEGTKQRAETDGEADEIKATEAARRRAEELGVDLREVEGTGSKGQITVQDVKKEAESEA
jgi:pyruvate/2-oxoglutarate dehydrogenase complex dihydrolipoamide acyltransferase (E2) component